MKFMLMRKADKDTEQEVMPSEGLLKDMANYNEEMLDAGVFVSGDGLRPSRDGCRIEFRNGEPLVTDVPVCRNQEQLAGFYLRDANDLNEALQLASRIPPARFGSIEVRPARELPPQGLRQGEPQ